MPASEIVVLPLCPDEVPSAASAVLQDWAAREGLPCAVLPPLYELRPAEPAWRGSELHATSDWEVLRARVARAALVVLDASGSWRHPINRHAPDVVARTLAQLGLDAGGPPTLLHHHHGGHSRPTAGPALPGATGLDGLPLAAAARLGRSVPRGLPGGSMDPARWAPTHIAGATTVLPLHPEFARGIEHVTPRALEIALRSGSWDPTDPGALDAILPPPTHVPMVMPTMASLVALTAVLETTPADRLRAAGAWFAAIDRHLWTDDTATHVLREIETAVPTQAPPGRSARDGLPLSWKEPLALGQACLSLVARRDHLPPLPPRLAAVQAATAALVARFQPSVLTGFTQIFGEDDGLRGAVLSGQLPALRYLPLVLHPGFLPPTALATLPDALEALAGGRAAAWRGQRPPMAKFLYLSHLAARQVGGELMLTWLRGQRLHQAIAAEAWEIAGHAMATEVLDHGHGVEDWVRLLAAAPLTALGNLGSRLARERAVLPPGVLQLHATYYRRGGKLAFPLGLLWRIPVTPEGHEALQQFLPLVLERFPTLLENTALQDHLATRHALGAQLGVPPVALPGLAAAAAPPPAARRRAAGLA